MLFPELTPLQPATEIETDFEAGVRSNTDSGDIVTTSTDTTAWWPTQDVYYPEFGHGWIQGVGHGKVTVRFETRTTQRSFIKTFAAAELRAALGGC